MEKESSFLSIINSSEFLLFFVRMIPLFCFHNRSNGYTMGFSWYMFGVPRPTSLKFFGYFTNVKFLPFRHFTIIKNISQLNVRHAFQASYPSTIVPQTWHAFKYPSIQKNWHVSPNPQALALVGFSLVRSGVGFGFFDSPGIGEPGRAPRKLIILKLENWKEYYFANF